MMKHVKFIIRQLNMIVVKQINKGSINRDIMKDKEFKMISIEKN